jgi:hypothetical protein
MSQRRLAVLGIVGVLLIVVVAGGFWIYRLEQRLAGLEREVASLETATRTAIGAIEVLSTRASQTLTVPAVSPQVQLSWVTPDNSLAVPAPQVAGTVRQSPGRFADGTPLPDGTTAHEINGIPYYIMPLADSASIAPLAGVGTVTTTRR